jgi:hypothetical protein
MMTRTPNQEIHYGLSRVVAALPENGCDLPVTLANLLGNYQAIRHNGVSEDVLDLFSSRIKKRAKALIVEKAPALEAERAEVARLEEQRVVAEREARENPQPDLGPGGRGWKRL